MEQKTPYETKALVPYRPLTPDVWQMIMAIGEATKESRQFGVFRPEEAAIKMLVAYEHNIPLTSALSTVYIIDNKPVFAPVLMWAKILNCPDFGSYQEQRLEDKGGAFLGWEMTLSRKSGLSATRRFTLDDARRVQVNASKRLIDKDNWKNYPEDVCYWRVMERCAKVVFADVVAGIYGADELGADISPDGDVIDSPGWTTVDPTTPQQKSNDSPTKTNGDSTQTDSFTTVDQLLALWAPDMIMNANGGKIPATSEECLAVAEKLEASNE